MAKAKRKQRARRAVPVDQLALRVGDRVVVTRAGSYVGDRVSTVRAIRGNVADIQIDGKHVTAQFLAAELAVVNR